MRLWSLHPRYLDARGLVALWREGLLARAVLNERTRGYRHHPQLERFQGCAEPLAAIDCYLWAVYEESLKRGYRFDAGRIGRTGHSPPMIPVTRGQLAYEWEHLKAKLRARAQTHYQKIVSVTHPLPHPLFQMRAGGIEPWERVTDRSGLLSGDVQSRPGIHNGGSSHA